MRVMKQETQLAVVQYKNRFTELLREVENGRRHLITRHGRPIARVAPVAGERSISETIASIRSNRVGGRRDLKALVRKGRR
jgi:prevent-host-death family protein